MSKSPLNHNNNNRIAFHHRSISVDVAIRWDDEHVGRNAREGLVDFIDHDCPAELSGNGCGQHAGGAFRICRAVVPGHHCHTHVGPYPPAGTAGIGGGTG